MKITKKGSGHELIRHDDPLLGSFFKVTENCPYLIELEEGELEHPAAIRLKTGIYELFFNNFVGWSYVGGELFKVRTPKLNEAGYDAMLEQITEVYASLPFAFNTPSFLPFERIAPGGEDILYHAFMFLRYILLNADPRLESIVERIIANPHRVMVHEQERQELHRARRLRPMAVNRLASCPRDLTPTSQAPHLADCSIAKRLEDVTGERHFPTHVRCTMKDFSVDNAENRFVRYFIVSCLDLAEFFRRRFMGMNEAGIAMDYILISDACRMFEALEGLLAHRFFDEVGEMMFLPYNSQLLQKGPGYRELFTCFNRMNLGSTYPIGSADLQKVIENKDVALLYEYWTFFACLQSLKEVCGEPTNAVFTSGGEKQAELPWDIHVDFDGGVSLFYNKTYHSGRGKGSYSLPYRPDISLETANGIYIFDAKFKKENVIYSQFDCEEAAETDEEEYSQGFKYGDINKMHCYRDAIKGTKAAFILYPGNIFRFYHRIQGKACSIDAFEDFDGVGAVPLRPSVHGIEKAKGTGFLSELLIRILED